MSQSPSIARRGSPEPARAPPLRREAVFAVREVRCGACARRAARIVAELPGVVGVKFRAGHGLARVRFDHATTSAYAIARALERAGYGCELVEQPASRASYRRIAASVLLAFQVAALTVAAQRLHAPPIAEGLAEAALAAGSLAIGAAELRERARRAPGTRSGAAVVFGGAAVAFVAGALGWVSKLVGGAAPSLPSWGLATCSVAVAALLASEALADSLGRAALAPLLARQHERRRPVRRLTTAGVSWVRADELCPGDRVALANGETVPADLVLETPALVAGASEELGEGALLEAGHVVESEPVVGRVVRPPSDRDLAPDLEAHAAALRVWTAPPEGLAEALTVAIGAGSIGLGLFAACCRFMATRHWDEAAAALASVLPAAWCASAALASPLLRTTAILALRELGILVKDVDALKKLANIDVVCFDETGTLGTGGALVTGLAWRGKPDPQVLRDVAAVAAASSGVVPRAVASYLRSFGVVPSPAAHLRPEEGPGSTAAIVGRTVAALAWPPRRTAVHEVVFGRDGVPFGTFEVVDPPDSDAKRAALALSERAIACRALASRPSTASPAHHAGVCASFELDGVAKAETIAALERDGRRVLFVWDGGDAREAAESASVSVAVRTEALPWAVNAPIVLVGAGVGDLGELVDLARLFRRRLRQNAVAELVACALLAPAGAVGLVSPLAAVLVAFVVTLALVANATRLGAKTAR